LDCGRCGCGGGGRLRCGCCGGHGLRKIRKIKEKKVYEMTGVESEATN
jgi:hypothetical protein